VIRAKFSRQQRSSVFAHIFSVGLSARFALNTLTFVAVKRFNGFSKITHVRFREVENNKQKLILTTSSENELFSVFLLIIRRLSQNVFRLLFFVASTHLQSKNQVISSLKTDT